MGEPIRGYTLIFLLELIEQESDTRRTETSKYPEEKKKTLISLVAASERETAQTGYV